MDNSIGMFAENFADCLINITNMPKILKKSYEDGCRIYVDLGSSMVCSRWIKETFKNYKDDILVLSLFNNKSGEQSILSMLSTIITNQINIDLSKLLNLFFEEKNKIKMEIGVNNLKKDKVQEIDKDQSIKNKDFLQKVILNQFNNNKNIFKDYISSEKKIIHFIIHDSLEISNSKTKECLYDYKDILEMTDGSMAKVLGSLYQKEDKYKVRARMPLPPYLFVTRILDINAQYGKFEAGSSIEAEYDIPEDCILKVSPKTVSSVVFSEAAHIGIFLAGYMGIDVYSLGKSKFRITDVSTRYVSEKWPQIGDTIRLKFVIERLVKNGNMTLLFCDF